MSFIRYKKTKSGLYAYKVTSYWDPEKKTTRQKTEYLGKATEEGIKKVRTSPMPPKYALNYGDVMALLEIVDQTHLLQTLYDNYHQREADLLSSLAIYRILKGSSFSAFKTWYETTYLTERLEINNPSSQNISRILSDIGSDEGSLQRFFYKWCQIHGEDSSLVYDITSFSSYSSLIELLEYGYNRDGENLPQINLGLVASMDSRLPLFYRIYPGSINDVTTLKNLIVFASSMGISDTLFIMDRGFYSQTNIHELCDSGLKFVIPMPFSTRVAQNIISATNKMISSPENARSFNDKIIYVLSGDVEIGTHKIPYYLYYDEERRAREVNSFYRRLIGIEEKLNGRPIRDWENADSVVSDVAGVLKNCFSWKIKSGRIYLKRKNKAISRYVNRMGKLILLHNSELSWDEALSYTKSRDVVERMFRIVKNDLSGLPLRVHKEDTLRGYLFVIFLSLVIYFELLNRMKDSDLQKKYSVETLLIELGKLRMVKLLNEDEMLTEITKKQRNIIKKMKLNNMMPKKGGD